MTRSSWLIGGMSMVKGHIHKCVTCCRLHSRLLAQVSNFPPDKLQRAAPFTYIDMDMFGPFTVRQTWCEMYVALFACLSCQAVHVEVTDSVSTDSFINRYSCFVCREGSVTDLWCDQGMNVIGANAELQKAMSEMDHSVIRGAPLKDDCDGVVFKSKMPYPPCEVHGSA